MATTSFAESFKYGSRLFGLFLIILLVGGGLLGLGAVLAVPEIQAWRGSGSAETEIIAGGLVLAVSGLSILVIGQFAVIYKLIADGVSKGNTEPAADLAAGSTDSADAAAPAEDTQPEDSGQAPAEQESVAADAADQPVESAAPQQQPPQEPESPAEPQPAAEPEPATQPAEEQPPTGAEPPDQQPAQTAQEQPQQEGGEGTGREQTAEEIVFGGSEGATEESAETETADEADEFELEEETDETSSENVETAGNPSSDPLADNFDDE